MFIKRSILVVFKLFNVIVLFRFFLASSQRIMSRHLEIFTLKSMTHLLLFRYNGLLAHVWVLCYIYFVAYVSNLLSLIPLLPLQIENVGWSPIVWLQCSRKSWWFCCCCSCPGFKSSLKFTSQQFLLLEYDYQLGLTWVTFVILLGKYHKNKSCNVHHGHWFQVPICGVLVQKFG